MARTTLTTSVTYRLVISGANGATGSYQFGLLDVSAQAVLAFDDLTTGTLTTAAEHAVFRSNGTAGQRLIVRMDAWGDADEISEMAERIDNRTLSGVYEVGC